MDWRRVRIEAVEAEQPRTAPLVAESFLPPTVPWNGESRALVVPADHEWATPSEETGLTRTPRYDETVTWLRRLVDTPPDESEL